jgi:orotate phosphoribosyltransferase
MEALHMHLNEADELSQLQSFLTSRSVRFGAFKLSAGDDSEVYVDAKLTTCFAHAMPLIGRAFLRKMRTRKWLPDAVGGLTVGADPIAFAIARESSDTDRLINAFIVRKEPKKHGMERFIEGIEDTADLPVVIIDDVCTKGASTAQAVRKARQAGMKVLGALCLVDRQQGATELLDTEFGLALDSIFTLDKLMSERPTVDTVSIRS